MSRNFDIVPHSLSHINHNACVYKLNLSNECSQHTFKISGIVGVTKILLEKFVDSAPLTPLKSEKIFSTWYGGAPTPTYIFLQNLLQLRLCGVLRKSQAETQLVPQMPEPQHKSN